MPNGTRENELCPVFTATTLDEVQPNPSEVSAHEWVDWAAFRDAVLAGDRDVSPWAVRQVAELAERATVHGFLTAPPRSCRPPQAERVVCSRWPLLPRGPAHDPQRCVPFQSSMPRLCAGYPPVSYLFSCVGSRTASCALFDVRRERRVRDHDNGRTAALLATLARGRTTAATPENSVPRTGSGSLRRVHNRRRDIRGVDAWSSRPTVRRETASVPAASNASRTPVPSATAGAVPDQFQTPEWLERSFVLPLADRGVTRAEPVPAAPRRLCRDADSPGAGRTPPKRTRQSPRRSCAHPARRSTSPGWSSDPTTAERHPGLPLPRSGWRVWPSSSSC